MRALLALTILCAATVSVQARTPADEPNSYYTEGGYQVERFGDAPRSTYTRRAYRHRAPRVARGGETGRGPGIIRSKTGATAHVNPAYSARFQCIVNRLDAVGYKIEFMGGYGSRPNNYSLHPMGMALDIDQVARDRLVRGKHYPSAMHINQVARKCGLLHGAEWADSDYGHFQVLGKTWAENQEPKHWPVALKKEAAASPALCAGGPAGARLAAGLAYSLHDYNNDTPPPPRIQYASIGPFSVVKQDLIAPPDKKIDEVADYLCAVYKRQPSKQDNTGDFTWKDIAAAKRMKMGLCQYVIGGMSAATRKAFFKIGKLLDNKGIRWSILSGFRDDWRQKIAAGIKAGTCRSLHGGSCSVGGYGNGVAVDVTIVGDKENGPQRAGAIFAKYGPQFGLRRPYPGFDPAHIQLANYVSHNHRWVHRHRGRHYASS